MSDKVLRDPAWIVEAAQNAYDIYVNHGAVVSSVWPLLTESIPALAAELAALRAAPDARLVAALQWYADDGNYRDHGGWTGCGEETTYTPSVPVLSDGGERARDALRDEGGGMMAITNIADDDPCRDLVDEIGVLRARVEAAEGEVARWRTSFSDLEARSVVLLRDHDVPLYACRDCNSIGEDFAHKVEHTPWCVITQIRALLATPPPSASREAAVIRAARVIAGWFDAGRDASWQSGEAQDLVRAVAALDGAGEPKEATE